MKRLITFCLSMLLPALLLAQTAYTFSGQSTLKVEGTSSLHDWTMVAKDVKGDALLEIVSGKLQEVKKLQFTLAAENLKSGKAAMDKNAYDALNTNKYPTITFKLSTINSVQQKGSETLVRATGVLTIAGVEKAEKVEAVCHINPDGTLLIKGSKQVVMSQYGVEPPSFMFGSVTTGDRVTISFALTLAPAKHQMLQ